MPAPKLHRRAYARLAALLASLALATGGRAADLGPNPAVGNGTLTLGVSDSFSGTLSVGLAGVNGGSLLLGGNYTIGASAPQGFSFTGTNSNLTYSSSIRTLTVSAGSTFLRSGTGSTSVFTNVSNAGTLSVTGGTLTFSSPATLTNVVGGMVSVAGTGSTLVLSGLANSGTLSVDNGGLVQLTGNFTTAGLGGTIAIGSTGAGGTLELTTSGTINNTGATLSAPGNGTYLFKGTIVGGNVGSAALTQKSGTLDGATLTGNVTVGNNSLTLKNGATYTDTLFLGATGASGGTLTLSSPASTQAGSALVLAGSNSFVTYSGGVPTFTLVAGSSLTRVGPGSSTVQAHLANQGTVSVTGGTLTTNAGFTNSAGATISVTGTGSTLALSSFANSGTLSVDSGGLVQLTGNVTTAQLGGTIAIGSTGVGGTLELTTSGNISNTGATLHAPASGAYLFKGTIVGGNVASAALTQKSGTLDGATITGNVTVGNNSLTLKNGAAYADTLFIGSSGASSGTLTLSGNTSTLAGSSLVLAGSNSFVTYSGGIPTFTIAVGSSLNRIGPGSTTLQANLVNHGTVSVAGGTLTTNAGFTNAAAGNISVTGAGTTLALSALANSGTLSVDQGGLVQLTGNFSTANLGGTLAIGATGGIELTSSGNITNTGATLNAPSSGSYVFKGTIVGGNVASAALTQKSGTLDGATITGNVTVGNNSLTLKNGATFTDTLSIGTTGTGGGTLTLSGNISSTAGSALVFAGIGSFLTYSGSVPTFTIVGNSSFTRAGAGTTAVQTHLTNRGTLAVGGGTLSSNGSFNNATGATISVTGPGSTLALTSLVNAGTLTVDNGGLVQLNGNFTTANLGLIAIGNTGAGGTVELTNLGNITNTGATLAAPAGGAYLFRGTVVGGNVASAALTQRSGTLDGATIAGFVAVGNNSLTLKNGATFTDTLTVGLAGVSGGSLALFGNISSTVGSALVFTGGSTFLTYSGAVPTFTLVGNSSLTRTGTGSTTVQTHLLNQGNLAVTGGTLSTNGSLTNATGGVIAVSGSGSKLSLSSLANSGTVIADAAGVVTLAGSFTTGGLGTVVVGNTSVAGVVELTGTLDNTRANLSAPGGGTYLLKGTIIGGTVDANALTHHFGTLDGALVTGDIELGSAQLTLKHDGGATGTLTVGSAGMNGGTLYLGSDVTTPANSAISFAGDNSFLSYTNSQPTLTISGNSSLHRRGSGYSTSYVELFNQGVIAVTGGTLYDYANVTNEGTITVASGAAFSQNSYSYSFTNLTGATVNVTDAHSVLTVSGLSNAGLITASDGGILQLTGHLTTNALGNITLTTGGSVELQGALDNTGDTLFAPNGGTYLFKGEILGGTVDPAALTYSSGVLDGAVVTGNMNLGNASIVLKNGAGFTGTATVGSAKANGGILYLGSNISLRDYSTLVFTGDNSYLSYTSSQPTLTIGGKSALLRAGAGYTTNYVNLLNQGTLSVTGGTLYNYGNVTNQGTVEVSGNATFSHSSSGSFVNVAGAMVAVSGPGGVLELRNLSNLGTLTADDSGKIKLYGNTTTGDLGAITLTHAGTVEILGTINNLAANLVAPTGGSFLHKGTILGGTIAAGAIVPVSGTLDAATLTGDLSVPSGNTLTLQNGATITGNTTVGAPGQNGGTIYLGSDLTLGAHSALLLTGTNSYLSYTGAGRTLTIPATASVIRSGTGGYTTAYNNFVNQGTFSVAGGTLYTAGTVSNQPGGTLGISNGATLQHFGTSPVQTGGRLTVNGTLHPGSAGLSLQGGVLDGFGTINGAINVSGGSIAPGTQGSIGTLAVSGGSFSLTNTAAFLVDIDAGSADKFSFINPSGSVNLGSGLLSLSLNLLSAPTAGTTYHIIQLTSGGAHTINGTFAGLPTSGSSLSSTFGATPYFFTVNYQANLVSLTVTPVPEPSTWALLAAGLLVVGLHLRRRRN